LTKLSEKSLLEESGPHVGRSDILKLIDELGLEPNAETFAYVSFGRDIEELEAEELGTIPDDLLEPWLEENEPQEKVDRKSAHGDWMDECVPQLMEYGKDQLTAVAACLNMWRQSWEESHPDGADDPGPSPKEASEDSPLNEMRQWQIEVIDGRVAAVTDFEVDDVETTMVKLAFEDGDVRLAVREREDALRVIARERSDELIRKHREQQEAKRLKSQFASAKRRSMSLLEKYNQDHDPEDGRFTGPGGSGGGGDSGGGSESSGSSGSGKGGGKRKEGESDKDFAKRVIDHRPTPKELPEKHEDYFKMKRATVMPIGKLVSSKSDDENRQGGTNGAKRMAAAAKGELSKRVPLSVEPMGDGKYLITDGNGTYTSVKDYGWKSIPVRVHVKGYKPGVQGAGPKAVKDVRDHPENGWVAKSPLKTMDHAVDASLIAQDNLQEAATPISEKLGVKFINPGTKVHLVQEDKYGNRVRDTEGHPVYVKDADGNPKRNQDGIDRVNQKMKPGQGVARVTDLARGTFTLNGSADGDAVVKELSKTYEVADEGWRTIQESGYTDRPLMLRDPETGQIAEIQLAHPGLLHAKEHGGHDMYKKARTAADAAVKASKAGNFEEQAKQEAIAEEWNAKMRVYYGKVLDKLGPEWKQIDGRL
jgi:hypothetical protein